MGILAPIKRNLQARKTNALKEKVLKNNENVLEIMANNIQGAKQCPFLGGSKCLGQFCEHFMEFKTIDKNKNERIFWRCVHVQMPLLLIELNQNIRQLLNKEKDNV